MYFVGTIMRLIYVFDTRLMDFWLSWVELVLSLCLNIYILYLFKKYQFTKFADVPNPYFNWKIIFPVCFALSYFFHPGYKGDSWFHI